MVPSSSPSRINSGTHDMFGCWEVKGEATELSASEREIPECAALRAPQSLAPSPHIAGSKINKKSIEIPRILGSILWDVRTDIVSDFLELLDENLFLFRTHSRKDRGPDADAREVFGVANYLKAVSVQGKNVARNNMETREKNIKNRRKMWRNR